MQNIKAFVILIPSTEPKKSDVIKGAMACVKQDPELQHVRVFPLLDNFNTEDEHIKSLAGKSLLAYITTTSGVISSEDCEKLKTACRFDMNCTALRDVQITEKYWSHIVEHNTFPEGFMFLQAANIPKGKQFTDLEFRHAKVPTPLVDTAKAGLKATFGLDETPFWKLTGEDPFTISFVKPLKPKMTLPNIADASMCADLALVKSKMSEATPLVPYANLQYAEKIAGVKTLRDALKSFIGSTPGSEMQLVGGAGAASGDMVYNAGNPDVEDVPVEFMDKVLGIVNRRQSERVKTLNTVVTVILPCETSTSQEWLKDVFKTYANREIMVLLPIQIEDYGWFMVGVCIENKRLYKMVCNTLPWDSEVDVVELFDAADALAAFVAKHLVEKVLTFPSYNDFSRAAFQCHKKNSRGYAIISMLMAILGLTPEKTETPNLPYANTFCENDVQELSTLVEKFRTTRKEEANAGALRLLKVAPAFAAGTSASASARPTAAPSGSGSAKASAGAKLKASASGSAKASAGAKLKASASGSAKASAGAKLKASASGSGSTKPRASASGSTKPTTVALHKRRLKSDWVQNDFIDAEDSFYRAIFEAIKNASLLENFNTCRRQKEMRRRRESADEYNIDRFKDLISNFILATDFDESLLTHEKNVLVLADKYTMPDTTIIGTDVDITLLKAILKSCGIIVHVYDEDKIPLEIDAEENAIHIVKRSDKIFTYLTFLSNKKQNTRVDEGGRVRTFRMRRYAPLF